MNEYKLKGVNRVDTLDTYRKMTKNPDELYVVDELNEMFFGTITLPAAWLRGDVNHDGEVNTADLNAMRPYYDTNPEEGNYSSQAADVNNDGTIGYEDQTIINGTFANKVVADTIKTDSKQTQVVLHIKEKKNSNQTGIFHQTIVAQNPISGRSKCQQC